MGKKRGARLVVDTCVVAAVVAEQSQSVRARVCTDILDAIYRVCHHAVLVRAMKEEWGRHLAGRGLRWRRWMEGRKKIDREDPAEIDALAAYVEDDLRTDSDRAALEKDFHLLEAALSTDRTIISLDDNVRKLFTAAAREVPDIRDVVWVNPMDDPAETVEWLAQGAHRKREWTLGHRAGGRGPGG